MNEFQMTFRHAAKGMSAQSHRLRVLSENMANVDTPGYHRKLIMFKEVLDAANPQDNGVSVDRVLLDGSDLKQVFDPAHPMANGDGYVEMSNVNILTEITDAREAQRTYEANLNIMDQARRMYSGVLDLLKR
jgi:flagellar basal-body rod protein FlgC